jgi:hypothetical protein
MVSLSTVYGISIVLGSLAAIGSAFVGTKVYPIQTGGDPLAGPAILGATITGAFAAAKEALEPKPEPLAVETTPEVPTPTAPEIPSKEIPEVPTPTAPEIPVEEENPTQSEGSGRRKIVSEKH